MNELEREHIRTLVAQYGNNQAANYIKAHHREEYKTLLNLTRFLPLGATTRQRLWHAEHDIWYRPKCEHCENDSVFTVSKSIKYMPTCTICFRIHRPDRVAAKKTMVERYGSEYTLQSPELVVKVKATNLRVHGVENAIRADEVQAKVRATNFTKYGDETYTNTDDFKAKLLVFNSNRTDEYNSLTFNKTRATTAERCGRYNIKMIDYSDQTIARLDDKDWLFEMTVTRKIPVYILARDYLEGYDDSSLWKIIRKLGIEPVHDKYRSNAEQEIADILIGSNLLLNSTSIIHPFEIDIFDVDSRLAIEYCGLYWHSDIKKDKGYHRRKYDLCKQQGIRLITIFEDEWLHNKSLISSKLLHILGRSEQQRVFARKTSVTNVTIADKALFFDVNHIQGNGPSSINLGLSYEDRVVAIMGVIKNRDGSFILNRYATSCNVVGGFSKLLKFFENQYGAQKIISFADLRWSEGHLYDNTGFTLDKELKPDYYWVKGNYRFHKFNFRHAGMKIKLQNYDATLSEDVNMRNHGYRKMFDCGKLRYVKN